MKIRSLCKEDLKAVLAIQRENPRAARWRAEDYESLAREPGGLVLVAELDTTIPPRLMGFAALHRILDEAELKNMAVARDRQRQGVGRELLREALRRSLQAGARHVYLEVRPSNTVAIRLYSSLQFMIHSRRKDYYEDPREDAYVMARANSAGPSASLA